MTAARDLPPPLTGVRVLELCHFLAGPYAGMVLADLGADLVKIEDPDRPDDARSMGPHYQHGTSLYFAALNSGKRSIGVSLGEPEGRDLVLRLVEGADVLIDNYRPGVLAKLGLDHATMRAVNPQLVTCSLSGYGATGPDARRPGYDYTIQALAGVMTLAGEPDGPPTKAGISYVDHSGGITAGLAVAAALVDRYRSGRGRDIDLGLFDIQISMLTYLAAWSLNTGATFERTPSSAHPSLVPAQNFATSDGHLALFVGNDGMWARFVDAIECDELRDARFAERQGRSANRDEVIDLVGRALRARTSRDWERVLGAAGVACGAVNTIDGALRESQTAARGLIRSNEHPRYGRYEYVGGPIPTQAVDRLGPAPLLGEHTDEILSEVGVSASALEQLRERRVIV